MKQSYGSGTPTLNSAKTNVWGVGKGKASIVDTIKTPEGSVNLPRTKDAFAYTPSVNTLEQITHCTDTRLQYTPIRYYR